LILLLLVTYIGFYFCRVTLPVAQTELQSDFGYSRLQVGQIASYYFAVYAAAKLLNGLLGARLAAKALLLLGISGSVVCNVAFSLGSSLSYFSTFWSLNAVFQSMGWIAIVGIVSYWFRPDQTGKTLATISISYLFGDTIARSSAGLILGVAGVGWRGLFWIHSAVFALVGLGAMILLKPTPAAAGLPDLPRHDHSEPESGETLQTGAAEPESPLPGPRGIVFQMLANPRLWIVCLIYLCLSMIRYAFWIWSVDYLQQECGLQLGSAAITSAVLPLAGAVGALVAGFGSDRPDSRRGPVLVMMTAALLAALATFILVPRDGTALQVAALALVGFFLIGPYSLLAGAVATDLGSKRLAATVSGVIDAVGAVGAIAMGAGMGLAIDRLGWTGALSLLLGIGLVAQLSSLTLWNTPFAHSTT